MREHFWFYVKVRCKHLLSVCMVNIHTLVELSMGNWAGSPGDKSSRTLSSTNRMTLAEQQQLPELWAVHVRDSRVIPGLHPQFDRDRSHDESRLGRDLMSVYGHGMCCLVQNVWSSLMISAPGTEVEEGNLLPSFPFLSVSLLSLESGESQKAVWGRGSELTLWVWKDKHFIPRPWRLNERSQSRAMSTPGLEPRSS